MQLKRIDTLDGLRGFAALLIIITHFPIIYNFSFIHKLSKFLEFNYLGVDIFFVLSGFLITRILIKEKNTGALSFRNFYLKRALRIFPAYYVCIIIVALLTSWRKMGWVSLYLSNFYFAFDPTRHPMRHTW